MIYCGNNLIFQAVKAGFQPTSGWGPALPENKTGKYAPKMDLAMTGSAEQEVGKENTAFEQETSLQSPPPPYTGHEQKY